MSQQEFAAIIQLINQSRYRAARAVNTELVNLYWQVGELISKRIAEAAWGDKAVDELADFIAKQHPEIKGFNSRGLYRMKQFYEIYNKSQIVSSPMTQLQNTDNQPNIIVSTLLTQFNLSDIRSTPLVKLGWSLYG